MSPPDEHQAPKDGLLTREHLQPVGGVLVASAAVTSCFLAILHADFEPCRFKQELQKAGHPRTFINNNRLCSPHLRS